MMDRPVVHIVDADLSIRNSLSFMLFSESHAIRTYESGNAFLQQFDPTWPGCVVLDLRLPDSRGEDVLQQIRMQDSNIPVIMLSAEADIPAVVRSMKLGASDLLQKPFAPRRLKSLVERAVQESVSAHTIQSEIDLIRRRFSALTAREQELLKLVVGGRANKQIARDLRISIKTVANHRAHLMSKTGAANAADLARLSAIAGSLSHARGVHDPSSSLEAV